MQLARTPLTLEVLGVGRSQQGTNPGKTTGAPDRQAWSGWGSLLGVANGRHGRQRLMVLKLHSLLWLSHRGLWFGNFVWEGNIPGCSEEKNVGAVETEDSRMLNVFAENRIEDPVEADHDIDDHPNIIHPRLPEGEHLAKHWVLRVRVSETPIHGEIPNGAVDSIQQRKRDERRLKARDLVDTVETQGTIVEDSEHVFAEVEQVRKGVPRVGIST
ncbi:uncharacterized protein BO95DRAFT_272330 [Aspergillus brunneoviolaceus CBS 621.78]|uniref:Uncharacterized protein n=1 Tax=Aspergillus brunneoviolaceus CBS 621.78 TaxID=1450534 RepID=A0ACD1FWK2_9EURO|nr:hypothetical protein BO95DRAFT_272330 [Aspergillus brunneoviolaceus CBS 621.78]RAH41382.1 hypothetical protein BO95DRAFT_272330 [Aspergillus brunneoviolaceus CBS 621.78]